MSTASSSSSSSSAPLDFPSDYDWNDSAPLIYGGSKKGAKQWQEDSFFAFVSPNQRVYVGGVFDGHGGYNGLLASGRARDYCKAFCLRHAEALEGWTVEDWQKKLADLFSECHNSIREKFLLDQGRVADDKGIVRSSNGDPVHGGSTGSIIVMVKEGENEATLITANVGDSTCLLLPKVGKWEFLSVDHGPENPEEFRRLQQLDNVENPIKLLFVYDKTNVFRKYECPAVFRDDGTKEPQYVNNPWGHGLHPTNVRYEPAVYAVTPRSVSKDSTCIAMTRALGDFYAHQFGLSAIPAIGVKKLKLVKESELPPENESEPPQDTFAPTTTMSTSTEFSIILASDGVWDCWKYEDFQLFMAEELYQKGRDLQEAGAAGLEESITRAVANFGSKHFDDACIVGWKFQLPTEEKKK